MRAIPRPRIAHGSSGVVVWAVHFAMIYGSTALACARGFARRAWLGVGVVAWAIGAARRLRSPRSAP